MFYSPVNKSLTVLIINCVSLISMVMAYTEGGWLIGHLLAMKLQEV